MSQTVPTDLRMAAVGAAGGLAATGAMSALMIGAQRAGLVSELPPHAIARKAVQRTPGGHVMGHAERRRLGWLGHFAFGAAAGTVYAVLRNRTRTPGGPLFHGSTYALAIWAVSYLGWIPAMRFLPQATDDEPGRPPTMIAAHALFGAVLGLLVERALPRRSR